jgi:hypothetical protein
MRCRSRLSTTYVLCVPLHVLTETLDANKQGQADEGRTPPTGALVMPPIITTMCR